MQKLYSPPSRRQIIKIAGTLAAGIAAPAVLRVNSALAAFPDRPVRIIAAVTPGGPADLIARMMAAALQESTGKTFVVENKPGGGGNVGMSYAAHSEPDGYTILLATTQYTVNVGFFKQLPFDAEKDFVGVSELATSPNAFVVKSDLPAKTIKEFVALARANPEKFNVSTPALNTSLYVEVQVLKLREKLPKMECVVFKGGGDAVQAILAGTVQMCSTALPPAAPHIKAGTLRALAVTGDARWPDLPNVPTMIESGYDNFVFGTDTCLLAPAKTPPEVVKWLESESIKVLSKPDIKEKLYKAGFLARPLGSAHAWARLMQEINIYKSVIDQAGIQKM
ncbi:MAG TPA: tripartite tricarboxylate transporter substrate binding protein [Pseudolabrys sp.]|nr:tripartite tricarboxylate transporter substrate binding protein [Pseudolabrys sp.]